MKLQLISAIAFIALTGAVAAQPAETPVAETPVTEPAAPHPLAAIPADSACTGLMPSGAPALPDGATANRNDMAAGGETYQAWGNPYLAKMTACRDEALATRARSDAMIDAYNAANTELRTITTAWEASVATFNDR